MTNILNFDEWLNEKLNNSLNGSNTHEKRFIDYCLELNESTEMYFNLNENRKNLLDDLIVEKIVEYVYLNGVLYEGFWGKFKEWAKEAGNKAVDLAKKLIGKIGEFIKGIKESIQKIFKYTVNIGKHYANQKANIIFARYKKEEHKIKRERDELKKDCELFKKHLKFTFSGNLFSEFMTTKFDLAKKNVQEDLKESLLNDFKNPEFLQSLNEEEINPDTNPKDINKKLIDKNVFTKIIEKIVTILTSGLVQMLEHVFTKGNEKMLEKWTYINNKFGGPEKNSLTTIAIVGSFVVTSMLEIGSSVFKKFVLPGSEIIEAIYKGVHETSLMGIVNTIIYHLVHNSVLYFIILGTSVLMSTYLLLKELNVIEDDKEIEHESTELYGYDKIVKSLK